MGASVGGNKGGTKSEINVTPLVDVVLVLLIIFMVVTPELQRGKEVELPKAQAAKRREDGGDPVVVSIDKSGAIFVEQEQVDKDTITTQIKELLTAIPGRQVLIKGDSNLHYGDVRNLITSIRNAGAPSVSLAAAQQEGAEGGAK
jgi:biopolymer transport protein TolR